MVLGQQFISCCDNWQLKWLLFNLKVHMQFIRGGGLSTSVTFRMFVTFFPVCNFLFILRGFPIFFVNYLLHILFCCLHLKYTYYFLYIWIPILLSIYYLIYGGTVFCFPCKVKAVFSQFKSHILSLEIFNPCVIHLFLFGSLKLILVAVLY